MCLQSISWITFTERCNWYACLNISFSSDILFIAKINGIAAVPNQVSEIVDSVTLSWSSLLMLVVLVMVLAEYLHPYVVHSSCGTGFRLHSSTYLRSAVNPRTNYPYQSLYCATETRACSIAVLFGWLLAPTKRIPDPQPLYLLS